MAKLNKKVSFGNAVLTIEVNGQNEKIYMIEEFKKDGTSIGKFNLSAKLDGVINLEGLKLSFDVTDDLKTEF